MGRHALKMGYDYQGIHPEVQDVNPLYGLDTYNGQFSLPPGGPADSSTYNLADFMFGLRDTYSLTNFFIAQIRQQMQFLYLQDDFKFSPKLTLNIGLRYEFATPQWEASNTLTNFDPVTNSLLKAT